MLWCPTLLKVQSEVHGTSSTKRLQTTTPTLASASNHEPMKIHTLVSTEVQVVHLLSDTGTAV